MRERIARHIKGYHVAQHRTVFKVAGRWGRNVDGMLDLKEFKILVALEEQRCKSLTQREISAASGLSWVRLIVLCPFYANGAWFATECLLIVGWKHSILTVLKGRCWLRLGSGLVWSLLRSTPLSL